MTNFFQSLSKRLRALSNPDPERDWLLIISYTTILLAAIIVWNAWAFDTILRGGVIGSSATTTQPLVSRGALTTVHTIITDRANEEKKYMAGEYQYVDPSQ